MRAERLFQQALKLLVYLRRYVVCRRWFFSPKTLSVKGDLLVFSLLPLPPLLPFFSTFLSL